MPRSARLPVYPFLQDCTIPVFFVGGDHDQLTPAAEFARVAAFASEPRRLTPLPDADHFFAGQLEPAQQALFAWLKEQLP